MEFTFTQKQSTVLRALLIAVLVLFVLNFLEPIQIHSDGTDFRFIGLLGGYGIVGGAILLLNEWKAIPFMKRLISNDKFAFVADHVWQLLTIAIGVCVYSRFMHDNYPFYNFPSFSYWEALEKTFLVSFIPVSIDWFLQYVKYQKQDSAVLPKLLHLKGELINDWLKIEPEQLLFITSSDNYVDVHYVENQAVHKKMLRATLKSMEMQVQGFPIYRCHQSFIVNLALAQSIKGNNRGMKLQLPYYNNLIPVSRRYIQMVTEKLSLL